MSDYTWQDVARFYKAHGNAPTYLKYKPFFVGISNPARKLRTILSRLEANQPEFLNVDVKSITVPPYGAHIDKILEEKVKLHMIANNNEMDNKTMRTFLVDILEKHSMFDLLREHEGECIFGKDWAARCRKRWHIINVNAPGKMVIDERVDMSRADCEQMTKRTRTTLRRYPNDPLPCKMIRLINGPRKKLRYEDEDEEDCWENILTGGHEEHQRLTLDDRLMLPCSIRSKFSFSVLAHF
jgi:hypothetical protein